jgi:serine/threonine protein kinase
MKTIKIHNVTTTGLDSDFADIHFLEVDEQPFAEGGFGWIYHVRSINGKPYKNSQVVKVFKDNRGSAAYSYKTIRGLQDGLIRKKAELDKLNVDFLTYYPAFFGAPQFVFEGDLEGMSVQGYSANNLKKFGYSCFTDVIEDPDTTDQYENISPANRFAKAYHLMRAFTLLNEIRYIHADFKSDNFFVSLNNDGRCALIDFDSGAIVNELEDEAFTVGTPSQDMLAPEIRRHLSENGRAMVNLLTDTWSVAVACHYLLFLIHPFNFLTEVSDNSIMEYNNRFVWPDVAADFAYFDAEENGEVAEYLKESCDCLPQGIVDCFRHTFTKGYFNPHFRTSYNQWCIKLKPYLPEGEARSELSKIRRDREKERVLKEEQERKERVERERLAKMRVKPDEYPNYISRLVLALIRKDTFLNLHKEELKEVGQQLNLPDLEKKVLAFMTAYYDIWSDDVISNTKRRKFKFLGKTLRMPEDTVELLLTQKL